MKKVNEGFVCKGCGSTIEPAVRTSRNHCPLCFLSLHVDNELPGDRRSECGGEMVPFEYVISNGEIKIHYMCISCGKKHRNKAAQDDVTRDLDAAMERRKLKLETSKVRPKR